MVDISMVTNLEKPILPRLCLNADSRELRRELEEEDTDNAERAVDKNEGAPCNLNLEASVLIRTIESLMMSDVQIMLPNSPGTSDQYKVFQIAMEKLMQI